MRWYHYISYFFGGAFLANAVPHFVNGVSGNPFQSPFAHPPGEGLSPALGNASVSEDSRPTAIATLEQAKLWSKPDKARRNEYIGIKERNIGRLR